MYVVWMYIHIISWRNYLCIYFANFDVDSIHQKPLEPTTFINNNNQSANTLLDKMMSTKFFEFLQEKGKLIKPIKKGHPFKWIYRAPKKGLTRQPIPIVAPPSLTSGSRNFLVPSYTPPAVTLSELASSTASSSSSARPLNAMNALSKLSQVTVKVERPNKKQKKSSSSSSSSSPSSSSSSSFSSASIARTKACSRCGVQMSPNVVGNSLLHYLIIVSQNL